ncbi:MAG: glycosyl transferase [Bacteroidetes bacterium]|nr:MAG: glycosyl transferase [Bacteroidota bacterium]
MVHNPKKICFLSDTHGLYDDRIYWKEAISLKKAGYEAWHIFVGDKQEQGITKEGIHYIGLPQKTFSKKRIANYLLKKISPSNLYGEILEEATKINADVYHLHDLKLNRIGRKLQKLPRKPKIIYDVHEPHPENILDYFETKGIFNMLKKTYAAYIRWWEMKNAKNYDFVIATEENVRDRFRQHLAKEKVDIIYNYTNLQDARKNVEYNQKEYDAIYCGGITKFRGAWQILQAAKLAKEKKENLKILFLGSWFPAELKDKMIDYIQTNDLTENVILHENVPYSQVSGFYNKSRIGLGIFLPIRTHKIILQIKIFEYMNFGLPIIGSNFGHINDYIKKDKAGISVNPEKPEEIADALIKLLTDNEMYNQCRINGMKAVDEKYNWGVMEKKLVGIYGKVLGE